MDMSMILTLVIAAILLLSALNGLRVGMVQKLAGLISLILSCVLVSALLPYVTSFLSEKTPVYEFIEDQCEHVVVDQISDALLASVKVDAETGIDRSKVKDLLNQYGVGYLADNIDEMSDSELEDTIHQYFSEYADQLKNDPQIQEKTSLTKVEQTKLIQELPIPDFLREMMLNYNNREGYRRLHVNDFNGYVVSFFANIILNVVAFLITLMAVHLILWAIMAALNIFSRLPILNLINHLGGFVVGAMQGLFAVWVIFLLISMFSGTEFGMQLLNAIDASAFLKPLYDGNIFMKIVVRAISGFM